MGTAHATRTAEGLAAEFMGRANEFGWVRLTAKQGAWLWSLGLRDEMCNRVSNTYMEGYIGSRMWKLVKQSNGSYTLGWV